MTLAQLQSKIYSLTKTNSTSYPNANMLIDINVAYNRIVSLIFKADGRWEWDDTNQTDIPVATTGLVSGRQDYALALSHLFIERVEVLPNGGTFMYRLQPRDVDDPMWGSQIIGIDTTTQAAPMFYDVLGTSVFLYPIPNYTQAASLKVYFKRAQIDFTSGDLSTGTAVPGFASLFHDLIAYLVAFDYAIANIPALANGYAKAVQDREMALEIYYLQRNHDDSPRLSTRPIRFK